MEVARQQPGLVRRASPSRATPRSPARQWVLGAGSSTTAQFAEQVRIVRDALAETGRDGRGFRIAKRVYIVLNDDAERARELVDLSLERLYGRSGLQSVAVSGSPDACVDGLRGVSEAGAELILLTTFFDQAEQMERLAGEVITQLT